MVQRSLQRNLITSRLSVKRGRSREKLKELIVSEMFLKRGTSGQRGLATEMHAAEQAYCMYPAWPYFCFKHLLICYSRTGTRKAVPTAHSNPARLGIPDPPVGNKPHLGIAHRPAPSLSLYLYLLCCHQSPHQLRLRLGRRARQCCLPGDEPCARRAGRVRSVGAQSMMRSGRLRTGRRRCILGLACRKTSDGRLKASTEAE